MFFFLFLLVKNWLQKVLENSLNEWIDHGVSLVNKSLADFRRVVGKAMQNRGSVVPFSLIVFLKYCT